MTTYLDRCRNYYGPLSPDLRDRLEKLIENPCDETWDDCHGIILADQRMGLTLWDAVHAVDPSFPRVGPSYDQDGRKLKGWPRIPDQLTIYRALRYAAQKAA